MSSLQRTLYGAVALRGFDLAMRRAIGTEYQWLMKTQWQSHEDIHRLQLRQLERLLDHAYRYSPFYRERLEEAGWSPERSVSVDLLDALPPLEKQDLQARLDDVSTVERWSGGRPAMWSTGGSTGVATRFYVDMHTRDRRQATQFRNAGWIGIQPGDPVAYLGGRSLGIRESAKVRHNLESRAKRQLFLPAWELDDRTFSEFADRMTRFQPRLLVGYSAALHAFAEYLVRTGRVVSVSAVLATGEQLRERWRPTIETAFDAPLHNRYGSIEVGDIAHSCAACGSMHVNDENLILHVDPSTHDLLVTDLTTFATPFIRYRIGDAVTLGPPNPRCHRNLSCLLSLQGRSTDVLHIPDGRPVSGMIFSFTPGDTPGITQYQIWQPTADRLQVLVTCDGQMQDDRIVRELTPALPGVRIEVIEVDRIEPAGNGKVPVIIRNREYTGERVRR